MRFARSCIDLRRYVSLECFSKPDRVPNFSKMLQDGTSIVDHLRYVCLVFVMLSRLFIAALRSPAGKGMTSWLLFVMFIYDFFTFPFGILGQVWYLFVSIPDLCRLSYFNVENISLNNGILILSCMAIRSKH